MSRRSNSSIWKIKLGTCGVQSNGKSEGSSCETGSQAGAHKATRRSQQQDALQHAAHPTPPLPSHRPPTFLDSRLARLAAAFFLRATCLAAFSPAAAGWRLAGECCEH